MTFDERLRQVEEWANTQRVDAQLSGEYNRADRLDAIISIIGVCRTQRNMIQTLEELRVFHEAEIARLSQLAAQ